MKHRLSQQHRSSPIATATPGSTVDPPVADIRLGTLAALDARLIDELETDNRRLEVSFDAGARALAEGDAAAAAAAFALCSEDLQRLQWIEALSLFPPLLNRSSVDAAGAARVRDARDAVTAAVALLRTRLDDGAQADGIDLAAVRPALADYLRVKRTQLYPLYQELVARDRDA